MNEKKLTDSELLLLGLLAEMPRHAYQLEQVIEGRAMREWTQLAFSSIYYVLAKLEDRGLVRAEEPAGKKAKKRYMLTKAGERLLEVQTFAALSDVEPTYSSLLLGMLHWPVLKRERAIRALQLRQESLAKEISRIESLRFEQQPVPDHVDAVFEYSLGQLKTEADWLERMLGYMSSKIWLD